MHLISWSSDKEDARILLDMPSSIDNVINDQVTLKYIRLQLHGAIYRLRFFCIDATLLCEFESDKI